MYEQSEADEYYQLGYADVANYEAYKLSYVARPLSKFTRPTQTLLCIEPNETGGAVDYYAPGGVGSDFDFARHIGGVHVLFVDTHVDWVTEIPTGSGDPFWNPYE